MKRLRLLLAVLLLGSALAQTSVTTLRGTWTASAGQQVLRGRWTAQISPDTPNTVSGTWALFNDIGHVVLEGTWSAEKNARSWRGRWAARSERGHSLSGTWEAGLDTASGKKSLQEMLQMTAEKVVAGWWQSGGREGNWWLESSPSKR